MDYTDYYNRLQTFENWPKNYIINPQYLAKMGFRYTYQGDSVICTACGVFIESWDIWDNPLYEHMRRNEKCPYVKSFLK